MEPDLPSKVIILLAFIALVGVAGWQANRIGDLEYENAKLKYATRTQFKKKAE